MEDGQSETATRRRSDAGTIGRLRVISDNFLLYAFQYCVAANEKSGIS